MKKLIAKIALVIVVIIVLWSLFSPTHLWFKGVNMGKLTENLGSNSVSVSGHLYPRMLGPIPRTWWNNASSQEPKFTKKADVIFNKWLAKHPGWELASATNSSGEKEDSIGRNANKQNRRQQISREYTLKKKQ